MSDKKPSQRSGKKVEDGAESADSVRSRSLSPGRSRLRQEAAGGFAKGPGKGSNLTKKKQKYVSSSDADADDFVAGPAGGTRRLTKRQKALKAKKKAEQQPTFVNTLDTKTNDLTPESFVPPKDPPKGDPNPSDFAGDEDDKEEEDRPPEDLPEVNKECQAYKTLLALQAKSEANKKLLRMYEVQHIPPYSSGAGLTNEATPGPSGAENPNPPASQSLGVRHLANLDRKPARAKYDPYTKERPKERPKSADSSAAGLPPSPPENTPSTSPVTAGAAGVGPSNTKLVPYDETLFEDALDYEEEEDEGGDDSGVKQDPDLTLIEHEEGDENYDDKCSEKGNYSPSNSNNSNNSNEFNQTATSLTERGLV